MFSDFRRLETLAKEYKVMYPKGTRIELIMMGNDPRPIASQNSQKWTQVRGHYPKSTGR